MLNARFSMRIDSDLKDWLESEAKRKDRSAGYIANHAIRALKQANDKKHRVFQKARERLPAGEFISDAKMDAWMRTWADENELALSGADADSNQN